MRVIVFAYEYRSTRSEQFIDQQEISSVDVVDNFAQLYRIAPIYCSDVYMQT